MKTTDCGFIKTNGGCLFAAFKRVSCPGTRLKVLGHVCRASGLRPLRSLISSHHSAKLHQKGLERRRHPAAALKLLQ